MTFYFERPVNLREYGLPSAIKESREEWYIFKAECSYKPYFPKSLYTSLGYGWWYINNTGEYIYLGKDDVMYLYSYQKDTVLDVSPIYRFNTNGK